MSEYIEGLVSTIIPVYNRPLLLRAAVESALTQTWRQVEILICDDGSTDTTPEVAQQLVRDHPGVVRFLGCEKRGAGAAREAGRRVARGEFIQYLDSDDLLWPRKFEVQIRALRDQPECGAAYGWIRLCPVDGEPKKLPHKWSARGLQTLFPELLVDRWWNTNAPLWRRSVCDEIGPWSDLRYSQDWDYDARAGGLGVRLAYCPEFVTDQRHHADARQTGTGKWLAPPDRVRFFESLHRQAVRAGVAVDSPHMRHFARWLFRQARECAEEDPVSAERLWRLSLETRAGTRVDARAFGLAASLVGWGRAARWFEAARGLVRTSPGRDTRAQSWMRSDD